MHHDKHILLVEDDLNLGTKTASSAAKKPWKNLRQIRLFPGLEFRRVYLPPAQDAERRPPGEHRQCVPGRLYFKRAGNRGAIGIARWFMEKSLSRRVCRRGLMKRSSCFSAGVPVIHCPVRASGTRASIVSDPVRRSTRSCPETPPFSCRPGHCHHCYCRCR